MCVTMVGNKTVHAMITAILTLWIATITPPGFELHTFEYHLLWERCGIDTAQLTPHLSLDLRCNSK